MITRLVSILMLASALLLLPMLAGVEDFGKARADSFYVNFTSNTWKDISVPPGHNDVTPTCYNLDDNQYTDAIGKPFLFNCTSPNVSVTCGQPPGGVGHCICHNNTKKHQTVKVHMDDYCHDPN